MPLNIKELVVVLAIAGIYFKLARPIALTFTSKTDFDRRRRAWFALTILAFLSPNIWVLFALAAPILVITGRNDANPVGVYLMLLHVIPPIGRSIPMLFSLNTFVLLSLCVLVPNAVRLLKAPHRPRLRGLLWTDLALIGYGVMNAFHYLQPEMTPGVLYPITLLSSIRRALFFFVITYIPYYVTSRSINNRRALLDSIGAYCTSCGLLAAVAIFESIRSWLLYSEMPTRLGDDSGIAEYLIRDNSLRAMASSGHPLTLATLLAIAIPLWLCLRPHVAAKRVSLAFTVLLVGGLIVTYSRGPWIGAAVSGLLFLLLRPRRSSNTFKTVVGFALAVTVLSFTPLGDKVMSLMPFLGGKADIGSMIYRERLFDRAVSIIAQHPFLGDTTSLLRMQDLRQGEGIIDLVNFYVEVPLNDGLIGLGLLIGFLLVGLANTMVIRRRVMATDPDMAMLGASLVSCIIGLLVTLAGGSLGNGTERMYYMLGGLAVAYLVIHRGLHPDTAGRPLATPRDAPVLRRP